MPSSHRAADPRQSTRQHPTGGFGTLHLGALTEHLPIDMVNEALTETNTHEQRTRRLSSARTVYFVLALALFPALGYLNVFAKLAAHTGLPARISAAALTGARRRLGTRPFQTLFELLRGPAATVSRQGSFHGRYRLCAIDGTILTLADTEQILLKYCKQPGLHGGTGYPQARLLALVACGTRSILDAVFGPTSTGETTYTRRLLRSMGPGMLVLADRNFASTGLLHQIHHTGARFLVRVKLGRALPVHRVLPDGSYLSVLAGMPVRVITAHITVNTPDASRRETYRLVTSLLDPGEGTVRTLMGLYHQRWEIETAFRELKSTLLQGRVLRSKNVLLVEQEILALLIVEQVLRTVMSEATNAVPGLDPDRASFTVALATARDTVLLGPPDPVSTPVGGGRSHPRWRDLAGLIGVQVLERLLPPRRLRSGSRTVKRSNSKYQARSSKPHTPTVEATYDIQVVDAGSLLTAGTAA